MTRSRTWIVVASLLAVAAAVALWRRAASPEASGPTVASSASPERDESVAAAKQGASLPSVATVVASASAAVEASAPSTGALVSAKWGGGRGDLGRDRPQEGNPEGPMSFALVGKSMVVLDQVNARVVRYDERGQVVGTSPAPATVQDIAVGADGTVALLDRLVGKSITLTDASGRKTGELRLDGVDPGLATGVFVDGKDVYIEKEHGALVKVGTTDGKPADEATQLTGRPSKDGVLLLSAGITSASAGRLFVNAFDRKKDALRFARTVEVPRPARGIVLLDTDARGVVYLGVAAGPQGQASLVCLDPGDGHVLGRSSFALSATPEEAFRDAAVSNDGTVVYALRTESGVEYRSTTCP